MPPIEVLDALRKKAVLKVLSWFEEITEKHEEMTCAELLAILREHKKREGWKDASL